MLKGVCEIELRDENGNVVQKTRDRNMLTDAINRLLNPDIGLMKTRFVVPDSEISEYLSNKLPILDGLIGGIVLFNEVQVENINNVIYKSTTQIVGSGSVMIETVPDDSRIGVFNKEESEVIKDENKSAIGIKFVWDFATNQANGTIRSVSLTTGIAGRSNYKNNLIMTFLSENLNILYPLKYLSGNTSSVPHGSSFLTSGCVGLYITQFKNGEAIVITDTKEIKRVKLKDKIGLADSLNALSLQSGDIIKTASIDGLLDGVMYDNYPNYFTNCDDKLYYCKIDKKVLTVVEFNPETLESTSKDINLTQILTHNRTHPVAVYNNCYAIPDGTTHDDTIRFVSMNDYTLVKSVKLGNSANITYGQYADYFVINNEGSSRGEDKYFMIDKNFDIVFSNSSLFRAIMPVKNNFIKDPLFMIRSTKGYSSGNSRNYGIAINPHIKFTIDNLATPVTKTASQTMKVIYTIQDAE